MNNKNQTKKPGTTRNRRVTKRNNNAVMRVERMDHPPQVNGYEITHSIRLRFTVTAAATNVAISGENILDSVLIATSAVAGFELFDIFRVRQVELWGQAALGTPSTVGIIYATPTGDQSIHTDTSLGVKPAYVKAIPSDKSLASFFTGAIGGAIFNVTCPAGSILDLSCDFRTTNAAATAVQNPLVGATVGELYYRGLDGIAIAATNFPPIVGVARQ